MTSCCFFVSLSSLCFATDEDGCAVENFCNTLFKCINYNLHEEMFCFNVEKDKCNAWVINSFLDNKIFKKCAHLSCPDVLLS